MKTRMLMIGLMGVMLCGCDQERAQRQEKVLEQRIAALEAKNQEAEKKLAAHLVDSKLAMAEIYTNVDGAVRAAQLAAEAAQLQDQQFTNLMGILSRAVTNAPPKKTYYQNQAQTSYAYAPALAAQPAMKEGIPAAVYDRIAAGAAERHPNSYSTQQFVIGQEVEAYKKLHP